MNVKKALFTSRPYSRIAEMVVLGSMLAKVAHFKPLLSSLEEIDFYYIENQMIFYAMKSLARQNKPADTFHVTEELRRRKRLEIVGGATYLTMLVHASSLSDNAEEYIAELKKYSQLRQLIYIAQNMVEKSTDSDGNPSLIALEAHKQIKRSLKREL